MTIWTQLVEEIDGFTNEIRSLPVYQPVMPAEIRTELESRYTFEQPIPLETLLADVSRLLRRWNTHVTHPRYFGLFNPSVRQAGIIADALVALYNPQLIVWTHAPAANEIERLTLRTLAKAAGFDPDAMLATFTSGGAEGNLSAVLASLAYRFPTISESGIRGLAPRPAIYLTNESHDSFAKIARMVGLGTSALRMVPVGKNKVFDVDALVRWIESDLQEDRLPLMVVGTAGTTGTGLIDPLGQIADVAGHYRLWFHVDAAWGGGALLSPRLRGALSGIDRADSVTWDAHKWLSVPMGAGMFFCRHPDAIKRAFAVSETYMSSDVSGQTRPDQTVDQYAVSVQWSRRMIGLKVFMSLAEIGLEGYSSLIEHQATMGDYLRTRLREKGWLLRNDTPLPVVCFTHPDIQCGTLSTREVLETVYSRGRVWISDVLLDSRELVLRACITSYRTNESDIECLIEELEHTRHSS